MFARFCYLTNFVLNPRLFNQVVAQSAIRNALYLTCRHVTYLENNESIF
jgi:hypothetical protein